jgi:hypothetical protein
MTASPGPVLSSNIKRLGLDEAVRLLPETNLHRVAVKPAICDDAVFVGRGSSQERSLSGAGNGRDDLDKAALPAPVG